jgi:hypothetical protein
MMVRSPISSSASAVLLALLAGAPSPAQAVDPTVSLDYSTYIGTEQSGTGVTEWLGIRYAAPPLGDLRFARPQDPAVVSTPQPANQVCLTVSRGWREEPPVLLHGQEGLTDMRESSMASFVSAPANRQTQPTPRRTACTSTSMRRATSPRHPSFQSSSLYRGVASTRTLTRTTTAQGWSMRLATISLWSPSTTA